LVSLEFSMALAIRTVTLAAAVAACAFQLMAESPRIVKIAVASSGQITADGAPITVEALTPVLSDLARAKGVVWYYREAPASEPHPNALKVLSIIVEHHLAVRLSSKPDYSDVIDDKGRSVPPG
jgi:hypothetical protein